MSDTLLAFDTDRIKGYVFATPGLKEIRGASALLDRLNRVEMPATVLEAAPGAQKIYAHGGGGLFIVPTGTDVAACRAVQSAYRKQTAGAASVTGVSLPLPAGFDRRTGDLTPITPVLQLLMRRRKDTPPEARAAVSLPFLRPCDICGEFPAAGEEEYVPAGEEPALVCAPCQRRQQETQGAWEKSDLSRRVAGLPGFPRWPESFTDIGDLSSPHGYLGLIYADGNGMGREIERLSSPEAVTQFAEGVDNALLEATRAAIRRHLPAKDGMAPFRVLLLGGDDLVLVTRADAAMDVALTLAQEFRAKAKDGSRADLSLSASVVLAHSKFPFRVMLDLAEGALKFAKKEGARRKLADPTLINFLTVTSANHVDFEPFFKEELVQKATGRDARHVRTLRPYAPADLGRLLAAARALRGAPRAKLHALGDCVFLSHSRSILEGLTTGHRGHGGGDGGNRAEEVRILKGLVQQAGTGPALFPWCREGDEWRTPLLDLVDLFEFVKEGSDAAAS